LLKLNISKNVPGNINFNGHHLRSIKNFQLLPKFTYPNSTFSKLQKFTYPNPISTNSNFSQLPTQLSCSKNFKNAFTHNTVNLPSINQAFAVGKCEKAVANAALLLFRLTRTGAVRFWPTSSTVALLLFVLTSKILLQADIFV
jgi:hypothetical protein